MLTCYEGEVEIKYPDGRASFLGYFYFPAANYFPGGKKKIFIKAPEFEAQETALVRAIITSTCSPSVSVTWKNRGTHARRKLLIKLMSRMSVASHLHPHPPTHTHNDYVIP